jgi:glycosyltransferase involved in cell wall biosynthesis
MFVAKKATTDPSVLTIKPENELIRRWRRGRRFRQIRKEYAAYQRLAGSEIFSDDRSEHEGAVVRQLPPADLINLHWTSGFVDYESFFAGVPNGVPLVWRLADMNALTGGCHYTGGCEKFTAQCGACPQLTSRDEHDLSRQVWTRKKNSLNRVIGRMHLVGTSRWITAEAQRSSLLKDFPATTIPNGLDTTDFAPRDKRFARESLGVPLDARVVLFVAESTDIVRKGYKYLVDALKSLTGIDKLMLMSIGGGKATIDAPLLQLHLGKIQHDRLLSIVYSAADVFVIPSLQESFGQTVIEAMACGTPVVGFNTGGIPDMVRPGITGELATVGEVSALRDAIKHLLSDEPKRQEMGENARRIAVDEYSMERQARAYLNLYEQLLQRRHAA